MRRYILFSDYVWQEVTFSDNDTFFFLKPAVIRNKFRNFALQLDKFFIMAKIVTMGEIMLRLSSPGNSRIVQSDSFDVNYGGGDSSLEEETGLVSTIWRVEAAFVRVK